MLLHVDLLVFDEEELEAEASAVSSFFRCFFNNFLAGKVMERLFRELDFFKLKSNDTPPAAAALPKPRPLPDGLLLLAPPPPALSANGDDADTGDEEGASPPLHEFLSGFPPPKLSLTEMVSKPPQATANCSSSAAVATTMVTVEITSGPGDLAPETHDLLSDDVARQPLDRSLCQSVVSTLDFSNKRTEVEND